MIYKMAQPTAIPPPFSPSSSPSPQPASEGTPVRTSPAPNSALDAAANALCIQALQQFRLGLSQSLLYTEGTKQFEKACESTFAALHPLLEKIGSFKLTLNKSDALVNGQRVDLPAAMRNTNEQIEKTMHAAGVNSLKFEQGLTAAELGPFLQLLARHKLPGNNDSLKTNQSLRDQGIIHIKVDEIRYVALGEKERVISGTQHSAAQTAITDLVDATLSIISNMQDPEAKIHMRAEVTDQLIEKEAAMFEGMLAATSQRLKVSESDELNALMALPRRDGKLLGDALGIAKALAEKGIANDDPAYGALRQLIDRISTPYKARAEDILSQVKLDPATLHVLPEWMRQAYISLQSKVAEERLEGILTQSPLTLLDEQMFPQIVDVLDEFSVARMDEHAERLAAHIAGAVRAVTKRERIKAVERLSFLLQRSMEQSSQAVKLIEDSLLTACTHETCDEVMKLLLKHLSARCVHHYGLGNYDRALEHLEWIASLEESSRLAMRDEGANLARKAREELGLTSFPRTIATDLGAPDDKGKAAGRMAVVLGPPVWAAIVESLKIETDAARAKTFAAQLNSFGKESNQLFYSALASEPDGPCAMRLFDLAKNLDDAAGLWEIMPVLLRHADITMRTHALEFVIQRDGNSAVALLVSMLQGETDLVSRKAWMQALARVHDAGGQVHLLKELETAAQTVPINEATVVFILELFHHLENPNPGIIAAVAALQRPRGRTLLVASPDAAKPPKAVMVASLRALARFYQDPAAVEMLERAHKDKDPDIARLALVCLRGIVAAEQQHHTTDAPPDAEHDAAAAAGKAGATAVGLPRKRHEFESFQRAPVESVFQVGVAVGGGGHPAPASPTSNATTKEPKDDPNAAPSFQNLKPTLEGDLKDCPLGNAVNMAGTRNGVLRIQCTAGKGLIYIKERKIVNALFAGKLGLEALASIESLKEGHFAYFLIAMASSPKLSVPIENLQDELRKFRDQKDQNLFF